MPLPTKPSPAEPLAIIRARRLDAMAAGLTAVALPLACLVAIRLGLPAFVNSIVGFGGIALLVQILFGGNYVRRARERLVERRLKAYPVPGVHFAVHCTYMTGLQRITDAGVLWRQGDLLIFDGLQTYVEIPSEASAYLVNITTKGSRNLHLQLNRGFSTIQIGFDPIPLEAVGLVDFVDDWNRAQPYADVRVEVSGLARVITPGVGRFLWHFMPSALFALYLAVSGSISSGHLALYLLFAGLGFAQFWRERRKLFRSL
jgi:hypothetical protein